MTFGNNIFCFFFCFNFFFNSTQDREAYWSLLASVGVFVRVVVDDTIDAVDDVV